MLICGDPGSRLGTFAAWIQNQLHKPVFEPGKELNGLLHYTKIHNDSQNSITSAFNGIKIRIKPSFNKLSTHLYLFLIKNVHTQIENFSKNQFDLETATKLTEAAQEWFLHDQQIDQSLYDIVLNFEDTYDVDYMIKIYKTINNCLPDTQLINNLIQTNMLNNPDLDKNHACVVSAMVLKKEQQLNLSEENRLWSFPGVYNTVDQNNLYDTISNLINHKNYSDGLQ